MILVRQPAGSYLCGSACVATVLGVSLEEAVRRVGKRGCTTRRQIGRALALGAVRRGYPPGRGLHLLYVHYRDRPHGWHWIVLDDATVYDPTEPGPLPAVRFMRRLAGSGGRVTSHCRIER